MIKRRRHHLLLKDIVFTRLKIDVFPISRLLLIQRPLKKELKSLKEVLTGVAILFDQSWHPRVDGLWEVLMECLLPGSYVLSLEHNLKHYPCGSLLNFCFGDCCFATCRLQTVSCCHPKASPPGRKVDVCIWKPSRHFGHFVRPSILLCLLLMFFVVLHFRFALMNLSPSTRYSCNYSVLPH